MFFQFQQLKIYHFSLTYSCSILLIIIKSTVNHHNVHFYITQGCANFSNASSVGSLSNFHFGRSEIYQTHLDALLPNFHDYQHYATSRFRENGPRRTTGRTRSAKKESSFGDLKEHLTCRVITQKKYMYKKKKIKFVKKYSLFRCEWVTQGKRWWNSQFSPDVCFYWFFGWFVAFECWTLVG